MNEENMFNITRIYSDANGDSHFEDIVVPLNESGAIGFLSEALPAGNIIFREVLPSYDYDFHTAPQRQYIVIRSKIDGYIDKIYVDEGAAVKRGQVLFKIFAPRYEQDVRTAGYAASAAGR